MHNKIKMYNCQENVLWSTGKQMYLRNLDNRDMFSEVTINNYKCHVSGFKEQIHLWQALLCFHVKAWSIKIYKPYIMGAILRVGA